MGETKSSGRAGLYLRFWSLYLERVRAIHPSWLGRGGPRASSWIGQSSGIPGTYISVCFGRGGTLRHEFYIDTEDAVENYAVFEDFLARRDEIEAKYGRQLDFQRLPNKRGCRIADHQIGEVRDEEHWNEYIRWFLDAGLRLRRALKGAGFRS